MKAHEVILLRARRKAPTTPYMPTTDIARQSAEDLLRLAQQLAGIHRTFTTQIGLERAEALKREMRTILER